MLLEASYFIAGITAVLASVIIRKASGHSSALFTHGKSKVSASHEPSLTRFIARFTVPKSWFWHFYALGLLFSVLRLIERREQESFFLPALLLSIQCLRRLVESFTIMPGGRGSEMHFIHYCVGVTYYPILLRSFGTYPTASHISLPILGFLLASLFQSYSHCILGRERAKAQLLPKPIDNPVFRFIHAPHYFSEFCIYFCIAALGRFSVLGVLNLCWIATMLGVSALNSAEWLCSAWKLKSRRKVSRYLMFPFIF